MKQKNEEESKNELEGKIKVSEFIETLKLIEALSSPEVVEEKLNKDFMEREGLKKKGKFRKMFVDSYFLPTCYDDAIVGVDFLTGSIIYDYLRLGDLRVKYLSDGESDLNYDDFLYGCRNMKEWIEDLTEEETGGKIRPTLCLYVKDKKYWNDIQSGGFLSF